MQPEVLRARIERGIADANHIITFYGRAPLDAAQVYEETLVHTERLRPYVADTMQFLNRAAKDGRDILVEGAQATLLDVDHGTYPYVTSSNTTAGGVCIGTGLAPTRISGVLGIVRTYLTRVGEGPFPTEMLGDEQGICELIRERGREYGSVTKRPRRCGWFDAFATRYAADINGFSAIALTKLDVLDTLEEIKVCVGYKLDGVEIDYFPPVARDLSRVEPIYETLPGWCSITEGMTDLAQLPPAARAYIDFLSAQTGVAIGLVSTGPERNQTIICPDSALSKWLEK